MHTLTSFRNHLPVTKYQKPFGVLEGKGFFDFLGRESWVYFHFPFYRFYKSFYMDAKSDKSRNIVELSPSSGNIIKYHFLITVSKQGDIWQC